MAWPDTSGKISGSAPAHLFINLVFFVFNLGVLEYLTLRLKIAKKFS